MENPASVFWDGSQTHQGKSITRVFDTGNTFHQLRNPHQHGASATLYDVHDLIFEDNIVYDIVEGVTVRTTGSGNLPENLI